jgi:hypothetical protein
LIIKSVLKKYGSTADFMVLLGFRTEAIHYFESDLALLRRFGIIPVLLPRWTDISHPLSFAEMALLKDIVKDPTSARWRVLNSKGENAEFQAKLKLLEL